MRLANGTQLVLLISRQTQSLADNKLLAEHRENALVALAPVQRIQRGKRFQQKGCCGIHRSGLP